MKVGVVFPQTEIGQDPAVIRDYAQAVESMGYTHILAFDSVVGANPNRPGGWDSQYTYQHAFHEPFVLFGFCAGGTRRIELVTGIIILPQRQTALVAKQAGGVDVLAGGRRAPGTCAHSCWSRPSSSCPSASRRSSPSRRLRWTSSRAGGCAWASESAGTPSSARRSARTSRIAASGSRNSSRSCGSSGPRSW